ncbi:MAG: carbon storage regulator [Gemmataceae bacterium]|jgi:carbon storage regulator|nr:carbon storage regulator [Gemmataceae bacterium]MCY2972336.1 carbon storage regulator [Planctomycetota bacterium]MBJ7345483.1 carbon storage regulator [Gemmataceae bacterium]MBJ7430901.1 carbon storage regulator [Gemmataceae bacterium]MBJ7496712.1 carbon storage regulator [Gemmataceae bacterium]
MLVLTRKAGEQIRIGKDIVVTVLEVLGNKVRVGIDAPDNISIVRGELIRNTAPEELSIEDKPIAIHMTVTHHHN